MYAPVLAGAAGSPPLCRCDLRGNCLLQGVGCTPWCWLGLLGLRVTFGWGQLVDDNRLMTLLGGNWLVRIG